MLRNGIGEFIAEESHLRGSTQNARSSQGSELHCKSSLYYRIVVIGQSQAHSGIQELSKLEL